ncbi:MAG: P-loop NTPase fold protein [Verrucomicrobiales bacterium]|nr:P-loop NTPase fold protein [Verrucomicrobiales bacterium]
MNKITEFGDDDLIGLDKFGVRLLKFIEVEHSFVEGGLVLALNSRFGFGKSTFLEMWKSYLEALPEEERPLIIPLNAWESDYYGDALFSLISALIEYLESHNNTVRAKGIKDAARDIAWVATAIGGQIAEKATGINAVDAGNFAQGKRNEREGARILSHDSFSIFQKRKEAMGRLKTEIKNLIESEKRPLLFIVDELDRCRPDFAISYLESIKHIFDCKGATFILAADRDHLENSARTAFGPDLVFDEYFRKFVHREVSLPSISDQSYRRIATKYVHYYLQNEGLRNCAMELSDARLKNITEFCAGLKLSPRQIQEVFRVLGHLLQFPEQGKLLDGICLGSIAMSVLRVGRPELYKELGSRKLEPMEIYEILSNLFENHVNWWFGIFLSGFRWSKDEAADLKAKLEENSTPFEGLYWPDWGNSGFREIYEKIEDLTDFAS